MKKDIVQKNNLLQSLPSIDEILKSDMGKDLCAIYPKGVVTDTIKECVALERKAILDNSISELNLERLFLEIENLNILAIHLEQY